MKNAREFVDDCRGKGYPDDRIRVIASMRPEPLRSQALQILDAEAQTPKATAPLPTSDEDAGRTASEPAAVQADAATPHPDVEALRQEAAAARAERDSFAADLRKAASEVTSLRAQFDRETADMNKRVDQEMWVVRRQLRRLQKCVILGGALAALVVTFLACDAISKSRAVSRLSNELAAATGYAARIGVPANLSQMPPLPLRSTGRVAKALAGSHHRHSRHQANLPLRSSGKVTKALARSHHRHPLHQPHRTAPREPQGRPIQAV